MHHNKPNILIIMPDQMRADCIGCAGNRAIRTPNFDRLAREGVRFDRFYTASPICMPARASFISAQWPHNHHMWTNRGRLPANYASLFRRLQQAGYRTAHIGKSHYYEHRGQHLRDEEPYMRARGFDDVHETTGPWATLTTDSYMTDRWAKLGLLEVFRNDYRLRQQRGAEIPTWPSPLPAEEYLDSYVGRVACEYLEAYNDPRPFALFVGFPGPHEPWDAPQQWAQAHRPEDMPPAIPPPQPQDWTPEYVAEAMAPPPYHAALTPEKIGQVRAMYYAKISLIDHWLGELLGVLDRRGWADNTLVVVWSDHGEMAGDHGRLHKGVFYEPAARVPLIMRWPERIAPGQVRTALASTVDLAPTILEAAGAADRDGMGVSLWGCIDDEEAQPRRAVFSEICPGPLGNIMVRTQQWKYAIGNDGRPYMLFDMTSDSSEQINLVGRADCADVERMMREELLRFFASAQVIMQPEGG